MIKENHHAKNGNWNWDILIREVTEADWYDGITVQSFGNSECIYEIRKIGGKWSYHPIGWIENRFRDDSEITVTIRPDPYSLGGWMTVTSDTRWCETTYSVQMNQVEIRNKKLETLGI